MTRPALRIGVLGAAAIAPAALVKPAQRVPGVQVAAIAARDRGRAEAFAHLHGIPVVHDSYADLLADPAIDALYIPLPNGLHAEWTLRAIAAGKHVLCEKPFTANRTEAEQVAAAAERAAPRLAVMEAMHYRYHRLAERMAAVVHGGGQRGDVPGSGGELGAIRRVEVSMCFPLPRFSNIRYRYALAGGAMMDAGCYAVDAAVLLGGQVPRIVSARARTLRSDRRVDRAMTAELAFPGGATGRVRASMWSRTLLAIGARVVGEGGALKVTNFAVPHLHHRMRVRTARGVRSEKVTGASSYERQLEAFLAAVTSGAAIVTSARDAVVTMGLLDDIYRAAGLPLRGEAPVA